MRILLTVLLLLPSCTVASGDLRPNPVGETIPYTGVDVGPIDEEAIAPAIVKMLNAQKQGAKRVVLHFDSPGGSVHVMGLFVRAMQFTERSGTEVWCVVDGMAASAGFYILQGCTKRFMVPQARLMAHEPAVAGVDGNASDLERQAARLRQLGHAMAIFEAGRLTISLEEFERRIYDRNYWMDGAEALAVGAVDAVLTPQESAALL